MASQRITREMFDTVVQEKMKRYRMTMDQAISETVRECQLDAGPSRMSMGSYDSPSRDQGRPLFRDPLARDFAPDMRRDSYYRESGGRLSDSLMEKLSDPLLKERLYRQELLERELNFSGRNWDLDESERFQRFRTPQGAEHGPGKNVFRSQGKGQSKQTHGKMGKGQGKQQGGPAGKATNKQQGAKNENVPLEDRKFYVPIVKWARFYNAKNDPALLAQHQALFKTETQTCKTALDCFKCQFCPYYTDLCFNTLKPISHPALKSPKIDNDLLDLLIEEKTVPTKNDFFLVIKPYDKQIMQIQQRLLHTATPLLLACNTFELKDGILSDPPQLFSALKDTVFLCRKALVLLGQTFALATSSRQSNVMEILGLDESGLNPAECPSYKDSFLFGKPFIAKLKDWLQKSGHKLTLKSKAQPTEASDDQSECATDGKDTSSIDPDTKAKINELLEYAKHGTGEKPLFWFLFDKNSSEYRYYRQKLAQFQTSKHQLRSKLSQTQRTKQGSVEPDSEAFRAMLYARKAQAVKRKLSRSMASLSKRRLTKAKVRLCKAPEVKQENETPEVKEVVMEPKKATAGKPLSKEELKEKPEQKASASELAKMEMSSNKKDSSANPQDEEVDDKTKDTAIKLAEFVVQMGPEIEEFSMQNSVNNPDFWFLRKKDSAAYKFYRSKVEEFKQMEQEAASRIDNSMENEDDLENIRIGDEEMEACEAAEASGATAAIRQKTTLSRPPIGRKRVGMLKVGMLPPKRVCLVDEPKVHDPVPIEYERPGGRGARRKKPADLEFANKKITGQNIGFKMLNKMGWQEGQGLGSSGSGITNPIKVGSVSGGEGLGSESTDVNFDAFRQRMMQMYKNKMGK